MATRTGSRSVTLKLVLLAAWAAVSFGPAYFARSLQQVVGGWPLNFWLAAQGCLFCFSAIVAVYAWRRGIDDVVQDEGTDVPDQHD